MTELPTNIKSVFQDSECPDSEILDLFVSSQLSDKLDQEVESHVEECRVCLAYLESKSKQDPHLFKLRFVDQRSVRESIYSKPEISGYRRIEFYKAGGQGVVFKGWDDNLSREVAVKVLKDYVGQDFARESSIILEARAIARLSHPNVVQVYGLIWTTQGPAMIMDWVEGESLLENLKTRRYTQAEAVEMLIRLCDAVALAHDSGILHRDIKPSNILLNHNRFNEPMLCDFGLAKVMRDDGDFSTATVGVGTAGYMPPEMISKRFGKISASADIYSIGAVLYHLLTGRLPHESQSVFETMEKTCDKDVIPPTFFEKEIPWDLETICLKCMRREPELRYSSVMNLKNDLKKFLENQPVDARRVSYSRRLKLWIREKPWLAALSGSLFSVLITSVIMLSYALNRAVEGERKTERELARTAEILRVSAPLLKRFLQFGVLKSDEISKIQKLSALLKEIGTDSPDLRQRYDLIYVGLQIASELKNVNGQQNLALEMISQARVSLKRLIDEHGAELDQLAHLKEGDKIAISLLDQSRIRYGHSCIETAHLIQSVNRESGWVECEPFVDEAIRAVEIVIRENPEVDEAFTDLANYYLDKTQVLRNTGMHVNALAISKKSEPVQARMMSKYPNDPDKVIFWLASVQIILNTIKNNDEDQRLFLQKINSVKAELNRVKSRNDVLWPLTADVFVSTVVIESRKNYRTRPIKDVENEVGSLLGICRELMAAKTPLANHIQLFLNIGLEAVAVLESDKGKHGEALALFRELERYFSQPSEIKNNPQQLAELYLRSPIPELRLTDKVLLLLKDLDINRPEIGNLRNILNVLSDPSYQISLADYTNATETQIRFAIVKAEALLNQAKPEAAREIVEKCLNQFQAYQNISIDYQFRLDQLSRHLQIRSRP